MKRRVPLYALALATGCAPAVAPSATPVAAAAPVAADLAIRGVTVVDVEGGRLLPAQTVLVRGNRITAVGSSAEVGVPAGATVVDGAGRFLIPGLWDMHAHLPEPPWLRTMGPQLFVAHGVTGVREMFSDCTVCPPDSTGTTSLQAMQRLRDDIRAGRLVGPRLLLSSAALDGPPGTEGYEELVRTPAEARAAVDAAAARGVDQIAAFSGMSRELFAAVAEQARIRGLPLTPVPAVTVTPLEAATLGARSRESLNEWNLACSTDADRHRAAMAAAIAEDARDSTARRGASRWLRFRRARNDSILATFDAARCTALARQVASAGGWGRCRASRRGGVGRASRSPMPPPRRTGSTRGRGCAPGGCRRSTRCAWAPRASARRRRAWRASASSSGSCTAPACRCWPARRRRTSTSSPASRCGSAVDAASTAPVIS